MEAAAAPVAATTGTEPVGAAQKVGSGGDSASRGVWKPVTHTVAAA